MEEEWVELEEFPLYLISSYGRVLNQETKRLVQPSLTKQGALKVSLFNANGRKTRSLKVLVAETFVSGKSEEFNTPVQLDLNNLNVNSNNLVWRPRWFAWMYTFQEKEHIEDRDARYLRGPILDVDSGDVYDNIYHVCQTNGLLWWHVYVSLYNERDRVGVFPTGQRFIYMS